MRETPPNLRKLTKYCVLCEKEFGPALNEHCTTDSLVAIERRREGFFRKRVSTRYFALDGTELTTGQLATVREKAAETRRRLAAPGSQATPQQSSPPRQTTVSVSADDLFKAAVRGDAAAVRALLDKGINVNAKGIRGLTALSMASLQGHFDVV